MSAELSSSNKKFEEALHLLNEAARDKKDEISRLLTDKYEYIKDALGETVDKNKQNLSRIRKAADEALEEGGERLKDAAEDIDEKVRENPWPYIGGVAIGTLLLGYILGASKK